MLSLWLLVQLSMLVVGAVGVRFGARWPEPPQAFALHEMLIAQLVCAAILFPWLMRTWQLGVIVVGTAWPFAVLAAMTAEASTPAMLAGTLSVGVSLVTFGLVGIAMQHASTRAQLFASATAMVILLGSICADYLAREFAHSPPRLAINVIDALTTAHIERPFERPLTWTIQLGVLIVVVLGLVGVRARQHARL